MGRFLGYWIFGVWWVGGSESNKNVHVWLCLNWFLDLQAAMSNVHLFFFFCQGILS